MIRVLAATFVFLPFFSLFAQAPAVSFEANAVVARVTPGAATAWISTNRVSGSNSLRSFYVRDDDRDGVVRWETGPISARSGWAVVDLANGGYTVPGGAGSALPEKPLPNAILLRGPAGKYSEIVVPDAGVSFRHYLVARAGVGAWQLAVADYIPAIPFDLDLSSNGITVFRTTMLRALGDAPAQLEGIEPGDVLIALDATEIAYSARVVDAAYLATANGPGVLHVAHASGTETLAPRVPIVRVGGSDGTVSVNYQTADKSAKSGVDYRSVSGAVTFLPGEVLQFIDVPTIPDHVYTGKNVALEVRLTNPVGTTVQGPSPVNVTISDGERKPSIVVESKSVLEGDGGRQQTTVRISLVGRTALTAVVPWQASGSVSATTFGTLRFAPGEVTKTITVEWEANDTQNARRFITVRTFPAQGENVFFDINADPPDQPSGTVTVLDDDGAPKRRGVRH